MQNLTQNKESNIQLNNGDNTMQNSTQIPELDEPNVKLSNGRYVANWFLCFVYTEVMNRIPKLPRDTELTLKQIWGVDSWSELFHGERKRAGLCMVHLVANKELPMMAVEGRHEYPKLYRRL